MAIATRRRKRCCFCGILFLPNPRLKGKQIACAKKNCQKARKKRNQENWLKPQPDYFKRRYPNTKRWLEDHPGYLAEYRKRNPEYVQHDNEARKKRHLRAKKARADIQVAISLQDSISKRVTPVLANLGGADIQDSLLRQIIVTSALSAYLASADIQDSIAPGDPRRYPHPQMSSG